MGLRAGRVRKISPPSGFDPWTAHPGRGLRLIFDLYFFLCERFRGYRCFDWEACLVTPCCLVAVYRLFIAA